MWIPRDAEEIERAARAGELRETPSFDAKATLPEPKRNADLATDVAAMATDGGVLLYGVAEDEHERPTIPRPVPLAGAGDRVGQIVASSIAEVPYIDVREHPTRDDPSVGYIVVIVPQSERAPHQVTVGGDLRYYGRGAKGNRRLTEGEVAYLYERRRSWSLDRDAILAEVIRSAPVPPREGSGYVHAFTRPVALDQGMSDRAMEAFGGRSELHQHLLSVIRRTRLSGSYSPSLSGSAHWRRRGADAWRVSNEAVAHADLEDPTGVVDLSFNIDGRGQLFCGRGTDWLRSEPSARVVVEVAIAGNVEALFAAMGALYEAAGYHGAVFVGTAVTGLQGALSLERRQRDFLAHDAGYDGERFQRTGQVAAAELKEPHEVAYRLLRNLLDIAEEGYNPFEEAR